MPHTPQEQQELPASFWTGLEFSKLHICPAAPSQGLLRATSVPLLWGLTWSEVHTQCKAHPKEYKQDSHSQGPFTSRACHVPRVAVCLEGCFLGFQASSVEFQRGLKGRLSSVPAELQIPTLVLLPPAISACCTSQQKWELWITTHTSSYSEGCQWEWVGSRGRCPQTSQHLTSFRWLKYAVREKAHQGTNSLQ